MASAASPQGFFLTRPGGQRFGLYHPAADAPRAAVVYVHPFADEMNKARRMAAVQSRALAAAGCAVLQIDLLGCGDSSGDFGDAGWDDWVDDVVAAAGWLAANAGNAAAPLWLWGLRAGALLASAAAARLDRTANLLLWQPTPNGAVALQQFLRLATAARMLEGGGAKAALQSLRDALAAGRAVEIAGYALSPALARGLDGARLAPSANVERVEWLEVSGRPEDAGLAPASLQALAAWEAGHRLVRSQVVAGPAFWQTVEIEEAPTLVAATLAAVAPSAGDAR